VDQPFNHLGGRRFDARARALSVVWDLGLAQDAPHSRGPAQQSLRQRNPKAVRR